VSLVTKSIPIGLLTKFVMVLRATFQLIQASVACIATKTSVAPVQLTVIGAVQGSEPESGIA
jgi:hypothetical protein